MSLLNEALRNVEQRQHTPGVASAYTGQAQAVKSRRKAPWVMLGVLGVVALGMAFGYWLSDAESSPAPAAQVSGGEVVRLADSKTVEPQVLAEAQASPVKEVQPLAHEPASLEGGSEPVSPGKPEAQPVAADEHRLPEPLQKTVAVREPPPEPLAEKAPSPEPMAAREQSAEMPEAPVEPATSVQSVTKAPEQPAEPAPAAEVRTTHATPASRDRAAAVAIRDALANGRINEARQTLAEVVETQAAPRSRAQWVRHLLVVGEIQGALTWAPADIAADHADLRLLRARAQHAQGRLDAALATLESQVPGVAADPNYAVTLATLQQQAGQYGEAASRWAELIAYDNARSAWWVGLAIALESDQRLESAARAYVQALELPDLSASLRDFVLQRLRAFEVGGSNG